jgi:alkylhydroperoxidase/carboxymuconolactone decarboxylase family protein YurZ
MKESINDENQINSEEKQKAHAPSNLKLISKRSGAADAFLLYRNNILENGPLKKKERVLIALASTVALKAPKCIANQTKNARDAGASEDEIIQTMLIVGLVCGNSPLSTAFSSSFEESIK